MFEYHVTFGDEKKIVSVYDKSTLEDVIRHEFGVDSSSFDLLLQSWNSKYNDWVNVSDVCHLPGGCKLQIIVRGGYHQFLDNYSLLDDYLHKCRF